MGALGKPVKKKPEMRRLREYEVFYGKARERLLAKGGSRS
jgi:hypothetical protein